MSNSEFIISAEHSTLLLNTLYFFGVRRFTVKSLLLNQELFEVGLNDDTQEKISLSIDNLIRDREQYERLRNGFSECAHEVPTFSALRDNFYASGVLKPARWGEISKEILVELDRDPLKGKRPVFISFDTNALIKCRYTFISDLLKRKMSPDIAHAKKPGYVLARGVITELERGYETKYKEADLSAMNRTFRVSREILDEFANQLALRDRMFRMGHVEYKEMSRKEYFEEEESQKGDSEIIKALRDFSRKKNTDVMVFSEDSDFIEKTTSNKLIGKRLDSPAEIPDCIKDLNWRDVLQLLYVTAIRFGVIGVSGKDIKVKVSGIWRGKKGENWNQRDLKITTHNPDAATFLDKSLKILR